MSDTPGIENRIRHLVVIGVTASLGEDKETRKLMTVALQGPVTLTELEEVVLQTALFAGVPRALNAMRLLQDAVDAQDPESRNEIVRSALEARTRSVNDPTAAGVATFEAVYGESADDVRQALAAQHPVLEAWILNRAYGEILSREGLDLKTRELIAVAVLSALHLPVQLWGHLRGALRNGATAGEVRAVLSLITLYSPGGVSEAQAMLDRLDR